MTRNTVFFDGWSLFKLTNFELALGTNLKFYTNLAKVLKVKVRNFFGIVPTFAEVTRKKLARGVGPFCPPPILNRVSNIFSHDHHCYSFILNKFLVAIITKVIVLGIMTIDSTSIITITVFISSYVIFIVTNILLFFVIITNFAAVFTKIIVFAIIFMVNNIISIIM